MVAAGIAAVGVIAVVIVLATSSGSSSSTGQTVTQVAVSSSTTPPVTAIAPSGSAAAAGSNNGGSGGSLALPKSTPNQTVTSTSVVTSSGPNIAAINGARQAVAQEWSDINSSDFASAYAMFVPGSLGSESSFIAGHQQAAPISASVTVGNPTFNSSTDATVPILSLQTTDSSGCKDWTGSYDVQNVSGQWLISRANISSSSC